MQAGVRRMRERGEELIRPELPPLRRPGYAPCVCVVPLYTHGRNTTPTALRRWQHYAAEILARKTDNNFAIRCWLTPKRLATYACVIPSASIDSIPGSLGSTRAALRMASSASQARVLSSSVSPSMYSHGSRVLGHIASWRRGSKLTLVCPRSLAIRLSNPCTDLAHTGEQYHPSGRGFPHRSTADSTRPPQ